MRCLPVKWSDQKRSSLRENWTFSDLIKYHYRMELRPHETQIDVDLASLGHLVGRLLRAGATSDDSYAC